MNDERQLAIAADGSERVVLAWTVADPPNTLMVATSLDGGDTWKADPIATGAQDDGHPSIATDGRQWTLVYESDVPQDVIYHARAFCP